VYISPYCRSVLVLPIFMKFGIRGQLTDVITCVKFLVDRFRGYGVLTPPKLPFPIDLLCRPYSTAMWHCDIHCVHQTWSFYLWPFWRYKWVPKFRNELCAPLGANFLSTIKGFHVVYLHTKFGALSFLYPFKSYEGGPKFQI